MKNLKKSKVINYDFTDNETPSDSLHIFAQAKKDEINTKRFQNKFDQNNSAIIIMVILIVCLIGLCGFTTYQIYRYENKINPNQSSNQIKPEINNQDLSLIPSAITIIPADGFSFVLDNPIPKGFVKKSEKGNFDWIKDKKSSIGSYLSVDEIDTENLTNGVVVYSAEFDNKYSVQEFAKQVSTILGEGFIDSFSNTQEQISLPNNTILYKISPKNTREQITYYTTVTATNYYVIKIYTQGKNTSIGDKADYSQKILTKLRLN